MCVKLTDGLANPMVQEIPLAG